MIRLPARQTRYEFKKYTTKRGVYDNEIWTGSNTRENVLVTCKLRGNSTTI